jgi:thiamine-phosphate pyrophosphorylase
MLLMVGPESDALAWQADGFHCRSGRSRSNLPRSAAVHNRAELREALRNRADLLFISPLFSTASHPGDRPLGRLVFNALTKQSSMAQVIALGGMDRAHAQTLNRKLVHGWAAIDAFRKNPV